MQEKLAPKTALKNGVKIQAVPPPSPFPPGLAPESEAKPPRKKRVDYVRPAGVPLLTKPELTRLFLDWEASCEKLAKLEAAQKKEEEARAIIVGKIVDGSGKKSFVWRRRVLTSISRVNPKGAHAWYFRETTKEHEILED